MAFPWKDYLEIARMLAGGPKVFVQAKGPTGSVQPSNISTAACRRVAISRAYYAAYGCLYEAIDNSKNSKQRSRLEKSPSRNLGKNHTIVRDVLSEVKVSLVDANGADVKVKKVAKEMGLLHIARKDADYKADMDLSDAYLETACRRADMVIATTQSVVAANAF